MAEATISPSRASRSPRTGHRSREERVALGRAARAEVPRAGHAAFVPEPGRDPVLLLRGQGRTRVADLLPIRYERMSASPFAYFRGAALPMAADLDGTPSTGLVVQACGDAHLANFGLFASPERRLVFDLNDFDETLPGPWEWDVKRLAASLEIAGRENGYTEQERSGIVLRAVASYRKAMRDFAGRTALEVWYAHVDADTLQARFAAELSKTRRKRLSRTLTHAKHRDNLGALDRFVEQRNGQPRIVAVPPLIVPIRDLVAAGTEPDDLEDQLRQVVADYRETLEPERRVLLGRYRLVDVARKVVGVGSVGTRSFMLLMLGDHSRDPLFLQAKEAGPSVLEPFAGMSVFPQCGQRVVVGQRLMQAVGDIFLGWVRVQGFDGRPRDFYVRQLRDWKGSVDAASMAPVGMRAYGELCGWTLARAHARSGDRVAIAAYLGAGPSFERAVLEFACVYADQNERDHAALVAAIGPDPAGPAGTVR